MAEIIACKSFNLMSRWNAVGFFGIINFEDILDGVPEAFLLRGKASTSLVRLSSTKIS